MVHKRMIIRNVPRRSMRTAVLMKAYDASGPGAVIFMNNPNWVEQSKWDGQRLGGVKRGTKVRLHGRSCVIYTPNFPFIKQELSKLKPINLLLDGEVVFLDAKGDDIQEFSSRRMRIQDPVKRAKYIRDYPVTWFVFDVLECEPLPPSFLGRMRAAGVDPYKWVRGANVTEMPLRYRLWLLESIIPKKNPKIKLVGTAYTLAEKIALREKMKRLHREGVMHKDLDGIYVEGRPSNPKKSYKSKAWQKDKFTQTDDVVALGWYWGKGNRLGMMGGFYMGQWDGKQYRYVGKVGSGLNRDQLRNFTQMMLLKGGFTIEEFQGVPLEKTRKHLQPDVLNYLSKPAIERGAWVKPTVVLEVKYTERSKHNILVGPAFLRLRFDKEPTDTEYPKEESRVSKKVRRIEDATR